ncbi:MAG: FAD-binding protein [Chitinophagaceae bacterium]|nr:FAD-binding protein [Chitinophagaceae bacterium]
MLTDQYRITFQELCELFANICGSRAVYTEKEQLYAYETDHTLRMRCPFEVLVKPSSPDQIAAILSECSRYRIPVTPRGGGSGVTGGALPVGGGVVLSLERLNKIISIDELESYVIAEAGVVTDDLTAAIQQKGLYYPVSPSSSGYSFIGGNVAENAGAVNSCKFGKTSRYVLNLEVALPSGEVIWTGTNVAKSSTGLNLTPLFVGSEGILGVITKVVLRLLPQYSQETLLLAAFNDLKSACETVLEIKRSGLSPSAVELIDSDAIRLTAAFLNRPLPLVTAETGAHLLVGLQERDADAMRDTLESAALLLAKFTPRDVLVAQTTEEKNKLKELRFSIGNAMTAGGRLYRDIDACVPVARLYDYAMTVKTICKEAGLNTACFGHALDGNLHTMIVMSNDEEGIDVVVPDDVLCRIYEFAVSIGGVISGEHGVGLLQKKYIRIQYTDEQLRIMARLKDLFDPNGILNPGKVL